MWRLPFHREADAFANLLWIDLVAMVWERVEIRGRLYWDVMGLYIYNVWSYDIWGVY